MSMHEKQLTVIEETGLIAHGFGRDIGKPSMAADIFRIGVEWGQMERDAMASSIKMQLDHGMPFDTVLRERLADLLVKIVVSGDDVANMVETYTYDPNTQVVVPKEPTDWHINVFDDWLIKQGYAVSWNGKCEVLKLILRGS